MTDAVIVFPPGFRVLDSSGNPVSGAKIKFWIGGTSTPKDVFSDAALTANLGSVVYTDSEGFPVASAISSTTVSVYVGAGLYDCEITDSADVAIWPRKINQKGALDTSTFITTASTSTLSVPVISQSSATLTVTTTHRGKLINCNSSGNNIAVTLDNAATLGDGWSVKIRKKHASNTVTVQTTGGEFIDETLTSILLRDKGDVVEIGCDGTGFYLMSSRIKSRENQVGDIRLCSTGTARTGELECNGASVLRADYPDLFSRIGTAWGAADGTHFNLPKLSGLHLRIWDHGAAVDPGAASRTAINSGGATGDAVGSYQEDALDDHTHDATKATGTSGAASGGGFNALVATYSVSGAVTAASADVTTETRPKNAYVAAYILATVY